MNRRAVPPPLQQAFGLVAWLLLVYAAAALGAVASVDAGPFFAALARPPWAPPAWLFGPVWSVLYTLMGVSAWLVWRTGRTDAAHAALALFLVQLGLNALWTWLFFVWRLGALATVEIALLWLLILATAARFRRFSRVAAVLLLPYLAWVGFAAVLSYALWRLNPGTLG